MALHLINQHREIETDGVNSQLITRECLERLRGVKNGTTILRREKVPTKYQTDHLIEMNTINAALLPSSLYDVETFLIVGNSSDWPR